MVKKFCALIGSKIENRDVHNLDSETNRISISSVTVFSIKNKLVSHLKVNETLTICSIEIENVISSSIILDS